MKQSSRVDELWRFKLEFPLIEALKRLLISLIGLQKTDHVRNENLVGILWLFNAHPCSQPADFKQCYNRMKKTKEKNTCPQFAVIHMASICSSLFYVCFKKDCCYYAKTLWTGRISVVCFFWCKKCSRLTTSLRQSSRWKKEIDHCKLVKDRRKSPVKRFLLFFYCNWSVSKNKRFNYTSEQFQDFFWKMISADDEDSWCPC